MAVEGVAWYDDLELVTLKMWPSIEAVVLKYGEVMHRAGLCNDCVGESEEPCLIPVTWLCTEQDCAMTAWERVKNLV